MLQHFTTNEPLLCTIFFGLLANKAEAQRDFTLFLQQKFRFLSRHRPNFLRFAQLLFAELFLIASVFVSLTQMSIPPGNVENGEKLFKARCAQCHTANKVGSYTFAVVISLLIVLCDVLFLCLL